MGKEALRRTPLSVQLWPRGEQRPGGVRRGVSSLCFSSLSWNRGDSVGKAQGRGYPIWLAAAWAFSVFNLCCRVQEAEVCPLFSSPKNRPLVSALPHDFPCKARSHPSLTATSAFPCCPSLFPILPPDPGQPGCRWPEPAEARGWCQRAGSSAAPGPSRLGCSTAFQYLLCRTGIQAPTSVRRPQRFHDTIFSHITEPTSFILSCACNFPHRHASSSQMPH